MQTVGVVLGKSRQKDSADDVAEWKGLLTPQELRQRRAHKKQGREPDRLPSDLILLRYMQRTAQQQSLPLTIKGIDSHKIKKLPPPEILKIFDRCDILLLLTTTFLYESRTKQAYMDFYTLLNNTRACVYPKSGYLRFLFDKSRYLKRLASHSVPIIPTRFWDCPNPEKEISANWVTFRSWLKTLAQDWQSPRLVLKGSHSAGKALLFEWDTNRSHTWPQLREWLSFICLELQMPSVLVQPYLDAFSQGNEIRTYWINEEFTYALAMGPPPKMLPRELTSPEGRIHPHLHTLLPLGKEILSLLPPDGSQPKLLVRLDFVLQESQPPRNSNQSIRKSPPFSHSCLLNEIEMLEACLFPDWTRYDIIEKLGDELLRLCQRSSRKRARK